MPLDGASPLGSQGLYFGRREARCGFFDDLHGRGKIARIVGGQGDPGVWTLAVRERCALGWRGQGLLGWRDDGHGGGRPIRIGMVGRRNLGGGRGGSLAGSGGSHGIDGGEAVSLGVSFEFDGGTLSSASFRGNGRNGRGGRSFPQSRPLDHHLVRVVGAAVDVHAATVRLFGQSGAISVKGHVVQLVDVFGHGVGFPCLGELGGREAEGGGEGGELRENVRGDGGEGDGGERLADLLLEGWL